MKFTLPKIYPITDVDISGHSSIEQVEKLVAGGARLLQLREKDVSAREFYDSALNVIRFARDRGILVIINDRVDIAIALNADGVHLGQDDLPPENARTLLGNDAIIGYSTHSIEQARAALTLPINYIAIGPIFSTKTKKNAAEPVGLNGLRAVRNLVGDFPLVAIGGIDEGNIDSVIKSGADSIVMIRAILSDPSKITERMERLTNQH